MKLLIYISFLYSLLSLSSCFVSAPLLLPTVNGPEAVDLFQNLKGNIIMNRSIGGIVAIELPSLKEISVKKNWDKWDNKDTTITTISRLGGTDNKGRIAFIGGNYLKVMDIHTGIENNIFFRQWSYWPQYKENYGESFSLSPLGGLVAFVSNYRGVQMKKPSALLNVGQLEIWNIDAKEKIQVESIKILDNGLYWFPDGKRLALVQLKSKSELENKFLKKLAEDSIYQIYKGWDKIPVVCVFDLRDNSIKMIDIGIEPVISPKGESVLMRSTINQEFYKLYTLAGDSSVLINFPGQSYQVFAFIEEDIILYRGYPTAGIEQKWRNTSTGGSIREFSLKIAQLNTNKFVTVLPSIDRWDQISFGRVEN